MNSKCKITLVNLPIAGLLGIAFIVLKLCKVIDWSWWWVTAPFWAPLALFVAVFIIVLICLMIYCFIVNKYYQVQGNKSSGRGSISSAIITPKDEKK